MHMLNLKNKINIQWMSPTLICTVIFIYMNWETFPIIDGRKKWNKKKKEDKENNTSVRVTIMEKMWIFKEGLTYPSHF